jgi:hypothetical protein
VVDRFDLVVLAQPLGVEPVEVFAQLRPEAFDAHLRRRLFLQPHAAGELGRQRFRVQALFVARQRTQQVAADRLQPRLDAVAHRQPQRPRRLQFRLRLGAELQHALPAVAARAALQPALAAELVGQLADGGVGEADLAGDLAHHQRAALLQQAQQREPARLQAQAVFAVGLVHQVVGTFAQDLQAAGERERALVGKEAHLRLRHLLRKH